MPLEPIVVEGFNPVFMEISVFIILIFSIVLHEYMHGFAAYKAGDPTAKIAGRLSLNPLVHIDPFGSVLLPLMLFLSKANFFIGYAKPVPINPLNFRKPRRDEVLVSLAGPFANLALGAILFAALFAAVGLIRHSRMEIFSAGGPFSDTYVSESLFLTYLVNCLKQGVIVNFMLATFNLVPIPPLDGSHLLTVLLPASWLRKIYAPLATFGFALIILLAASGFLSMLLVPAIIVLYFLFSMIGI